MRRKNSAPGLSSAATASPDDSRVSRRLLLGSRGDTSLPKSALLRVSIHASPSGTRLRRQALSCRTSSMNRLTCAALAPGVSVCRDDQLAQRRRRSRFWCALSDLRRPRPPRPLRGGWPRARAAPVPGRARSRRRPRAARTRRRAPRGARSRLIAALHACSQSVSIAPSSRSRPIHSDLAVPA